MKCLFVKQRGKTESLAIPVRQCHHLLQLLQVFQLSEQNPMTPLVEEMAKMKTINDVLNSLF